MSATRLLTIRQTAPHTIYQRLFSQPATICYASTASPQNPVYKRTGVKAPPYKPPQERSGPPPILKYPESLINPPELTLPPPLNQPPASSKGGMISNLLQKAKGYVTFYKTGFKQVLRCRKILMDRKEEAWLPKARVVRKDFYNYGKVPTYLCRAEWVLMTRVNRDMTKLPIFGVLVLTAGELTPLFAVQMSRIFPGTCRLPTQIETAEKRIEERRAASFMALAPILPNGLVGNEFSSERAQWAARRHVIRSLDLIPRLVDVIFGSFMTGIFWELLGPAALRFIAVDDGLLRRDWTEMEDLSPVEVRLACVERGINVQGMTMPGLKGWLKKWLELTECVGPIEKRGEEAYQRVAALLTLRPDKWRMLKKGFKLPDDVL